MTLAGQVALITGASRGLGLETARLLARRGAQLVMTARGAEPLEQAANELRRVTDVVAVPGDVANPDHAEWLVSLGLARFGKIDALVNNASLLGPSPLPELAQYPIEALAETLRANAVAPLHLAQLVLPGMRERRQGVIVNVSSDAAVEAYPGWGGYGASKAALEHLSRVLAVELEGTGIRVYVVDPGDMDTQMHREAEPGVDLSHLPPPSASAPAIAYLIEHETAPSGRFQAQAMPAAAA